MAAPNAFGNVSLQDIQAAGAGPCAGSTAPSGEAYYLVASDGSCPDGWITQSDFTSMVNQSVAAGDEAIGSTVPADIPTADASAGTTMWDGLKSAASQLKGSALDALGGLGDWSAVASFPGAAAAAGTFYVGWQIGSQIASFLGIDNSTNTSGGATSEVYDGSATGQAHQSVCSTIVSTFGHSGNCSPSASDGFTPPATDYWVAEFTCTGSGCPAQPYEFSSFSGAGTSTGCSNAGGAWGPTQVNNIPAGYTLEQGGQAFSPSQCHWAAYMQPLTVQSLPGPGQNTPTLGQTINGGNVTPPAESTQKTNAGTVLGSGSYAPWTNLVCSKNPDCNSAEQQIGTIVLPQITPNETYAQWAAAAQAAGLLGTITQSTLTDAEADPSVAPDDVVRTSPAAGTRVQPQQAVTVYTNPDAVGSTSSGAPGAPTLPGVTIPAAATPCSVFPFGLPCWLSTQMSSLVSTSPQAPDFRFTVPQLIAGPNNTVDVNFDHPFGADLTSIMAVVRIVLLVLSAIGLMVWLGGMALGGSTSGGGDDAE